MKVYTVTVKFVMSVPVVSSQSTTDIEQATRFTSSIAGDVECAMEGGGYGRIYSLDVSISVKDVDENSIPEHQGKKWFWCTLNGDAYDVNDIHSGEEPIDGYVGEYYHSLNLASPIPAFKIDGKIFEHWFEVVDYCKNKLGK